MRYLPCGGLYKDPGPEGHWVVAGENQTGRQMGLKASVRERRQQRESAPGTQRKGPVRSAGTRQRWVVCGAAGSWAELLITCSEGGNGLCIWPKINSTRVTNAGASWGPSASQSTQQHHSVQTPNGWVCKRHPQHTWRPCPLSDDVSFIYKLIKVLNTPRDHLKKGAKRENVEVPSYYQIHTPIDLGMATQEAQGGSGRQSERKRRVLAREKAPTVSCSSTSPGMSATPFMHRSVQTARLGSTVRDRQESGLKQLTLTAHFLSSLPKESTHLVKRPVKV